MSSCLDAVPCSRLADVDSRTGPLPPPWVIAGGIVAALALIFLLGVGYGQQWGARAVGTAGRLGRGSGHLRRGGRGAARGGTKPTCARDRSRDQQTARVHRSRSANSGARSSGQMIRLPGPSSNYLDDLAPALRSRLQPASFHRDRESAGPLTDIRR